MKSAIAVAALALSLVSAAPTAPPAKFAISITAELEKGKPVTLYLGKDGAGTGVADIKDAAACSITPTSNLVCDGKTMGATPTFGYLDMAPLAPAMGASAMTDNYSVDDNMVLHWKSAAFAKLPTAGPVVMKPVSEGGQGGEAFWGLMKSSMFPAPKLFQQLGCPGGTHTGLHAEVIIGSNKVVPL